MAHTSDPDLLAALALRLKGFGEAGDVAAVHGLDVDTTRATLEQLAADGKCMARDVDGVTKFVLTPTGREEGEAALAAELDAIGERAGVQEAYERFLELNGQMLQLCTDWQVVDDGSGDQQLNDHSDDPDGVFQGEPDQTQVAGRPLDLPQIQEQTPISPESG